MKFCPECGYKLVSNVTDKLLNLSEEREVINTRGPNFRIPPCVDEEVTEEEV